MEDVLVVSAHKYGNYHKYYTFHPSTTRSSFFARDDMLFKLWEGQGRPEVFRVLDIGCNEGNLTVDILEEAKRQLPAGVSCVALGVDIDANLIDLANAKYASNSTKDTVTFKALDFMDTTATEEYIKEYATSQEVAHGGKFSGFDVVCLFSITMWIHLNHGDSGLLDCLERSATLVSPNGSLVVEPQPWKCYKAADKRCRKLGITRPLHYSELQIRDIENDMVKAVMGNTALASKDPPAALERESTPVQAPADGSEKSDADRLARKEAKAAKKEQARQRKAIRAGESGGSTNSSASVLRDISASMGMHSYWDLGKEGWGRSILIFHRSSDLQTKVFPSAGIHVGGEDCSEDGECGGAGESFATSAVGEKRDSVDFDGDYSRPFCKLPKCSE
jgi:SAM-dependent methyltransferase